MTKNYDLGIDLNRLDDEWVGQAAAYYKCASELADARRDWEEAKSESDVVKAETALAIRKDPEAFGLVKVTEKAIETTVPLQPAVRVADKNVIDARHRMDVLQAAVTAFDHRKAALQKLVELFLANYFSKPTAPEGAKDRMDEVERKVVRRKGRRRDAN